MIFFIFYVRDRAYSNLEPHILIPRYITIYPKSLSSYENNEFNYYSNNSFIYIKYSREKKTFIFYLNCLNKCEDFYFYFFMDENHEWFLNHTYI